MKEKKIVFTNIANEVITDTTGKLHWISRSPAVVGIHVAIHGNEIYLLIEKRSAMMDEPNKLCVPCGYLDWNESGYEAIIRETFEETGFYVPAYQKQLLFDNDKQPFYVQSDPGKDAKQNISLSYIFAYKFNEMPMHIEQFKNDEISEVKWLNLKDFLNNEKDMDFAFNHNERIHMAIKKFLSI